MGALKQQRKGVVTWIHDDHHGRRSDSRARGQWGERMADDILRACGLVESVQYRKNRIKELQGRGCISVEEGTLDYVLLFIPNEQVYGFIQENFPGLVDEALAQKVVLCSPFTLYAVLGLIRQSFDNFHFAQATQEVFKMISHLSTTYETFKARFAKLGEQVGKVGELYSDIEQPEGAEPSFPGRGGGPNFAMSRLALLLGALAAMAAEFTADSRWPSPTSPARG